MIGDVWTVADTSFTPQIFEKFPPDPTLHIRPWWSVSHCPGSNQPSDPPKGYSSNFLFERDKTGTIFSVCGPRIATRFIQVTCPAVIEFVECQTVVDTSSAPPPERYSGLIERAIFDLRDRTVVYHFKSRSLITSSKDYFSNFFIFSDKTISRFSGGGPRGPLIQGAWLLSGPWRVIH